MKLTVLPLTPDRWPDLEAVFTARGCSVARGCWCMAYRRSGTHERLPGLSRAQANRASFKALVNSGSTPGLIALSRQGSRRRADFDPPPRQRLARSRSTPGSGGDTSRCALQKHPRPASVQRSAQACMTTKSNDTRSNSTSPACGRLRSLRTVFLYQPARKTKTSVIRLDITSWASQVRYQLRALPVGYRTHRLT
jgi:hypothetical protein